MRFIRIFIFVQVTLITYQCVPEEIILQGGIRGTVTDAESGDPIPEVLINLDYINSTVDADTSGPDGTYNIKHITPGAYDISASKSGYTEFSEDVKIDAAFTYQEDIVISKLPYPEFSDQYLDFGFDSLSMLFTISNVGSGNLRYTLSASQNWISVFPEGGVVTTETDTIKVSIKRDEISVYKQMERVDIVSYLGDELKLDTLGVLVNGVADQKGNYYGVVTIGTQTWMAENLNTGKKLSHLSTIPADDGIIEKFCYDNLEDNCDIYGGLYGWDEMMDYHPADSGDIGTTQGVCPDGWHIPTVREWTTLGEYLGGLPVAGGKLKADSPYWKPPNKGATDETGFSALPGGRTRLTYTQDLGEYGYYFTSQRDSSGPWYFRLQYDSPSLYEHHHVTTYEVATSVRCIKDPE